MARTQLDLAVKQIEFARNYTQALLAEIEEADWFREVPGCPSHVAWQVGHLAMAQYALTMIRLRGKETEDEKILSKKFFRCFQKGTTPQFDAASYPPIADIRSTFDCVYESSLKELEQYSDEDLSAPLPEPYAVSASKLGSVFFCATHEMLHAGQIGLIRRMLGQPPVR